MRASGRNKELAVQGYAGSTGVLLACDLLGGVDRSDVLGLAIEAKRRDEPWSYLPTKLAWAGEPALGKTVVRSDTHPIQKFRWSDYGVEPGRTYHYRVRVATGDWRAPSLGEPVELQMRTERYLPGGHEIIFNRAAGASDAFDERFASVKIDKLMRNARKSGNAPHVPVEVLDWLSRGLVERITDFIDWATDRSWGLDIAIHEYERDLIVDSVEAALARGVDVRVVYHARPDDPQTAENERNLVGWPSDRLRPRITNAVCNQKFIVASRWSDGVRSPCVVLTGSTNFTHDGLYHQANVAHVMRDRTVAAKYFHLFEHLFAGSDVGATKDWIDENNPLPDPSAELSVGFSPRSRKKDLRSFVDIVSGATRDVLFVGAHGMYAPVEASLLGREGDGVVRLGLVNQRKNRITGFHRDRTSRFATRALGSRGLDGFLRGSKASADDILLHSHVVIVDFTSDSPTVITGSHDFSAAASGSNDENHLVIRGRADIADCYGLELLRIYDHYHGRSSIADGRAHRGAVPALTKDGSWTDRYWDDDKARLDRLHFAGTD